MWTLVDNCYLRSALPLGARIQHCTIAALRQHGQALLRSARFLSRWGTAQAACCAAWHDVARPRTKRVIGPLQPCICQLCNAPLPSQHALAAHIHRKHSVVSCYTRFTNGTVCFWCNTEMHSTDRLKYHLRTTAACMHGLRVKVGEVYTYGTGTKRSGRRRHVGLPAIRLPGPLNATPAQRLALLEGRVCTATELAEELRAATGASDVHEWPSTGASDVHEWPSDPRHNVVGPTTALDISQASPDSSNAKGSAAVPPEERRWFRIVAASQAAKADVDNVQCSSPLWARLVVGGHVWCLPTEWHHFWKLWTALEANAAWDADFKSSFSILRRALLSRPQSDGPSWTLLDIMAATVTFRKLCECIAFGGAMWIRGRPSTVGRRLLQSILPTALMYSETTTSGSVFVVAHPSCQRSYWLPSLHSLCDVAARRDSPAVLPLRATFVYRTRSQD